MILLAVFAAGVAVAGIFQTDPEGAATTASGTVHELAFLVASLCLIAATILVSRGLRKDDTWRSYAPVAWALALLALVAFIAFVIVSESDFAGVGQRVFVAAVLAWLLLAAIRLRGSVVAGAQSEEDRGSRLRAAWELRRRAGPRRRRKGGS